MRRRPRPSPKAAVEAWNGQHDVGIEVTFVHDDRRTVTITKTRAKAAVLSGHTPVIWLEGLSGCVLLDRVAPKQPEGVHK